VIAGVPSHVFGSNAIGANSATAAATVTSKVNFTAGTALSVTAGGNVVISGGSRGGDGAIISAIGGSSNGHKDKATLTVDQSVNIKGATVALTASSGAGNVSITTYLPSSAASRATVSSSGAGNTAKATVNGSVVITAKTPVTIGGSLHKIAAGASTSGNLIITSTITVTGHAAAGGHSHAVHTSGFAPEMGRLSGDTLRVAPDFGTTSFGGMRTLGGASVTPAVPQPAVTISDGIELPAPAITSLDTMQVQSLVPSLVTVTGDDASQTKPQSSPVKGAVFQPDLAAADFAGSFPSSCAVLVMAQADHRCPAGGK
jgi:hypothetical protein